MFKSQQRDNALWVLCTVLYVNYFNRYKSCQKDMFKLYIPTYTKYILYQTIDIH